MSDSSAPWRGDFCLYSKTAAKFRSQGEFACTDPNFKPAGSFNFESDCYQPLTGSGQEFRLELTTPRYAEQVQKLGKSLEKSNKMMQNAGMQVIRVEPGPPITLIARLMPANGTNAAPAAPAVAVTPAAPAAPAVPADASPTNGHANGGSNGLAIADEGAPGQDGERGVKRDREADAEVEATVVPAPALRVEQTAQPLSALNSLTDLVHVEPAAAARLAKHVDVNWAPNPGPGREGEQLARPLLTNFVKIKVGNELKVYQYDVQIVMPPKKNSGGTDATPPKDADVRRAILERGGDQLMGLMGGQGSWAYDGDHIMYTTHSFDPCELSVANLGKGDSIIIKLGGSKKEIKIALGMDGTRPLAEQRVCMAPLDILLQSHAASRFKMIGSAFFDERKERERASWATIKMIGPERRHELWMGYRQTVVITDTGPMLQIDRGASTMLAPIKLLDYIAKKMKKDPKHMQLADFATANRELKRDTKKWKFSSPHCARGYIVRGISDQPASRAMFTDNEAGRERSVADWFAEKFPNERFRADLPCAQCGAAKNPNGVLVPIELLSFKGGQRATKVGPELLKDIITETAAVPTKRFRDIENIHKDILKEPAAKKFCEHGLELANNLFEVKARRLPPVRIEYGRGNQVQVKMDKGDWNLRGERGEIQFKDPAVIDGGFVVICFDDRAQRNSICQFMDQFLKMAGSRGMKLGRDLSDGPIDGCKAHREKKVEGFLQEQVNRLGKDLKLLIIILPGEMSRNGEYLYPAIKRWSHTVGFVPTQCVNAGKCLGKLMTSPQYHSGVLMKLNLKLGGRNQVASNGLMNGLMDEIPTMVLGIDVNHAAPGSSQNSIASIVSSFDNQCSMWHTITCAQPKQGNVVRTEQIDNIGGHLRTCIKKFTEQNCGQPPLRIIVYRDGVGESMFNGVISAEVAEMRSACASVGLNPEFVFVVCQMRTRARFALTPDNRGSSELRNVQAGTVVDEGITEANLFNFYMVPHGPLKGTSRPSHYYVLVNDPQLNADQVQRFTFELCHLYARATKIVSRPAPVYYAHHAAFMARYYVSDYKVDDAAWETMSNTSHGSGSGSDKSTKTLAAVGTEMADTIYYS